MTPQQKIKWLIIDTYNAFSGLPAPLYPLTEKDELKYDSAAPYKYLHAKEEVRCSGIYAKHLGKSPSLDYIVHLYAHELPDGSWVCWPYYIPKDFYSGNCAELPWEEHAQHGEWVEKERIELVSVFSVINSGD